MNQVEKYDNLKTEMPYLPAVLLESLQSEFLEIRKINTECNKFVQSCSQIPEIKDASYVIFSQHIKKNEHKHEIFVFTDSQGKILKHVSGKEMELYGLLSPCSNLHISDTYKEETENCHKGECRI